MNTVEGCRGKMKSLGLNVPLPPTLVIYPTSRCNLRCEYCAERGLPRYELTLDEAKTIIDEAQSAKIYSIGFSGGGEPTQHPDFMKINAYCTGKFERIVLATNGTYATTEKRAAAFQRAFTEIQLVYDNSRLKYKTDLINRTIANAILAAVKNNKTCIVKEFRTDPIERLNSPMGKNDPFCKLREHFLKKYRMDLKVSCVRFEKETVKLISKGEIFDKEKKYEFEVWTQSIAKEGNALNLEGAKDIQRGCWNFMHFADIGGPFVGYLAYCNRSLYPCCAFRLWEKIPLVDRSEIAELRTKGINPLEAAIKRAYQTEWLHRYRVGQHIGKCRDCMLKK